MSESGSTCLSWLWQSSNRGIARLLDALRALRYVVSTSAWIGKVASPKPNWLNSSLHGFVDLERCRKMHLCCTAAMGLIR